MIDIIIPAYNAHDTIYKTLCSICMQTIKDKISVYIVNDNSKKDYSDIVDLFKEKIKIKELKLKKNSGPGSARQYGIDHSKGEYIYFLDADDVFIDCFSLENLYNQIDDNDIISGVVYYEDSDNTLYEVTNDSRFNLHGKLYRRSYIEKNKFKFNNSYKGEDNSYNRLLKIGTEKYIYSPNDTSAYLYNPNSITSNNLKDYRFYEVTSLADNMIWLADEADKRNFDRYKVVYELYRELIHFTFMYINYKDKKKKELNIIYDAFSKVYNRVCAYNIKIKKKDFEDLFYENSNDGNAFIMFNDIFNYLIEESKNED